MKLEELKNKRVLIFGFGKEGQDTFSVLKKLFPKQIIGIYDQQKIKKAGSAQVDLSKIGEWDVVIKTPGIPTSKLPKLKKDQVLTSQTEIFFDNFKGTIVGVTGTKGKGTVASLIYSILKKAGKKVELVGNIGRPALGILAKKKNKGKNLIFIYELSSHQLQNLKKSPHIAVFTNLFRDHLDYYKSTQEYRNAKANITKYQTKKDWLIWDKNDKKVAKIAQYSKAKKRTISGQKTRYQSHLKGNFNGLNVNMAVSTAKLFKAPERAIKQGILAFPGLPHRLEFVGKYKEIEFYNDSMATIPEVTIAALKSLKNTTSLIVGGSEKGSDYKELAKEILKSNVKNLIILGRGTGQKVWQEIQKIPTKTKPKKFVVKTMKRAVKIAFENTNRGEACLMSPGAASFNLFKNYEERGNLFKKWVKYNAKKKV